ncbi:DNA-binding transcriptional LysR family regulator [Sphingomonas zeicaulis]|uniref:LysR family transcriptional regulator n=1 Tax=Sphingomonas zeicaulis TaxID=1632740 RepID=UPI003D209E3F
MIGQGGDRPGEMDIFVRVVRTGSFSAAARELKLTPSGVSRAIARLEARLGIRLMIRTTRTISLTPEGETYHRAALRILRDIDETEQAIAEQASPRGRLRVSVAFTYGQLVIVPLLSDFLARYPEILVDISLSDTVIDLTEGRADVAIRVGPLADSGLLARRLGGSTRSIIASPDYLARHGTPTRPEDLLGHNCLGFNFRRTRTGWPFRRDGRDFELMVTGNVEANNGDTVVQLARDGVGIARVGSFHIQADLAAGRLVTLLDAYNPGDQEPFHALFVGGATIPARVRVFVDYLAERLMG